MLYTLFRISILYITGLLFSTANADALQLHTQWHSSTLTPGQIIADTSGDSSNRLTAKNTIEKISLTGGSYWTATQFTITQAGEYVIDFRNTSIIGNFRHTILSNKKIIDELKGGLSNNSPNPYFLRNGRDVFLAAGTYRIVTTIESEFYLAQPELYLADRASYLQSIKPGNALVLIGLGIFIGLGIYYATLAMFRKRLAEAMYSAFILGNLLFNSSAHLLLKDLFSITSIYMTGGPILLSNITYIIFVIALLDINKKTQPLIFNIGIGIIFILSIFALFALILPNWTLEFARYGVALFLSFGLLAGISGYKRGNTIAKVYLVAIGAFFILGGIAITQTRLTGTDTLTIEHIGLVAVAAEAILLGLVLSYQFALLQNENKNIQEKLVYNKRLASTDSLTGLFNRMKLDQDLQMITDDYSLTFIDIDNLKYYNDQFGHARGDELLNTFSHQLKQQFEDDSTVYRIGGDEFAVLSPHADIDKIDKHINTAIEFIRSNDFSSTGASFGSALKSEARDISTLKHLADMRMYNKKHLRKMQKQVLRKKA